MQNLFLGNAKYVFKLSVKKYLLRKKEVGILERKIHSLDEEMDSSPPPPPQKKKIASNYSGYTASQRKNGR